MTVYNRKSIRKAKFGGVAMGPSLSNLLSSFTEVHEAIDMSIIDNDSITLNERLNVAKKELALRLKAVRPVQIITSDNPDVDLDEDSMLGGSADLALEAEEETGFVLSELDKLLADMPGATGMKAALKVPKTKNYIFYALSTVHSSRRFIFEAELRQSTFTYGRMTFRLLLSNTKAMKLLSFFQTGERKNGNTGIFAEKIRIHCMTPDKTSGKYTCSAKTHLPIIRSKKVSQCKLIGLEVRQSKALKADKAIVVINFSTNG